MAYEEIAHVLAGYKDRYDLNELAEKMGTPYSSLARIMNENDAYDLGVKKLIPFILATNMDFTLLDHIEARLGRVAMSVGTSGQPCDFERLSQLARETGHAMTAISEALADGTISRKEASVCIKEIMHIVQVAMGILQELKEIENGDKAEEKNPL